MKRVSDADDLRAEYDFASMKGGVRGKYVRRIREGTNSVLIEPDVADAFPTEAAVNETLRGILNTTRAVRNRSGLPDKALERDRRVRTSRPAKKKSRAAGG